jgi:hypothetical protein
MDKSCLCVRNLEQLKIGICSCKEKYLKGHINIQDSEAIQTAVIIIPRLLGTLALQVENINKAIHLSYEHIIALHKRIEHNIGFSVEFYITE